MKLIFTLLPLLCSTLAFSQTEDSVIVDSLPIIENVMIYKDARLDVLEKRPYLMAKLELEAKANERVTVQAKPIISADGKKKVTGSIYTTKGYRIIIYNGSDRALAMAAKNKFSKTFSSQRSYMSYNVPSYKIKVGDFEDKKDANSFLKRVSAMFPSSFIVPDLVTVKNINVSE